MKSSTLNLVLAVLAIVMVLGILSGVVAIGNDDVNQSDNVNVGDNSNNTTQNGNTDNNNSGNADNKNTVTITFKYRLDGSDDYFRTTPITCEKEEYISVVHPTIYGYKPDSTSYEGNVFFNQTVIVTYKPVSDDGETKEVRTVTYTATYDGDDSEGWYVSTIGEDNYYISTLGAFNALVSTSDMNNYIVHGTTTYTVISGPAFDFVTTTNTDGGELGDLSLQSKDAFLTVFNYSGTIDELKTLLSETPLKVQITVQVYEEYFQ